jgi:hypothetical protein
MLLYLGSMATTVAWTFGQANFGKLWGLLYLVSGLLNFCIAPLALLAKSLGSYHAINVASLAVSVFLMSYRYASCGFLMSYRYASCVFLMSYRYASCGRRMRGLKLLVYEALSYC